MERSLEAEEVSGWSAHSGDSGCALPFGQELEIVGQPLLHFLARDDGVDQAVVEEEFGGLKTGRQFGLGRVFDDARSGKADHGAGFGDDEIADARVTRHHAGHGRMGQHADVGQLGAA